MCGIVGAYGFSNQEVMTNMLKEIHHRGPDQTGYFFNNNLMLGIKRLSILDPKFGYQPMQTKDKEITIVFNGEIFNFLEIKDELIKKGIKFKTSNSDTEVILLGYKYFGEKIFKKLNGMFAIAIFDNNKKKLLLARDRSGIKPLFFFKKTNTVFFASEIKAFFKLPFFVKKPNIDAVRKYFSLKNIPSPSTAFKDIFQINPGEYISIQKDKFEIRKFWKLKKRNKIWDKELIKKDIYKKLFNSVKIQLRSDVDVGCFLSGGLDSSAISIIASKYKKNLKTFSIVYDNKYSSKSEDNFYSKKVAKLIKSDHFEFTLKENNIVKDLHNAIESFDQPFSGTITSYFMSKVASKYVKVALSGDGADELFGSYKFPRSTEAIYRLSKNKFKNDFIKNSKDYNSNLLNYKQINNLELYEIKDLCLNINSKNIMDILKNKELKTSTIDYLKQVSQKFNFEKDIINKSLMIDFSSLLPDQVLSFVDILSMQHSLEIRPPFLDNDLIDLAFRIPGEYKIVNSNPKIILKEALKRIVPKEILYRKKEGFVMPIEDIFIKKNKKLLNKILSKKNIQEHNLFNQDFIKNLIKNVDKNNFYQNNQLWISYCFQNWWNKNF